MTLSSVRAGDIVRVDIRGHRFLAEVEAKDLEGLAIKPLVPGTSNRRASARQVIEHWSRRRTRKASPPTAQEALLS